MQNNKPDLMSYYNYMLNHSYYTTSLKSEKPINGTNIHTVKVKPEFSAGKDQFFNVSPKNATAASINILKYDFKTDSKNFTTYIWKEAGIAVIFYPKDIVLREYNTLKKTNNLQ